MKWPFVKIFRKNGRDWFTPFVYGKCCRVVLNSPQGISFLCFRPNNFKIIFIYAIDLLLLIYSGSNGWLFFTMAVIICMSLFLTLFNATCFFFPLFTSLL